MKKQKVITLILGTLVGALMLFLGSCVEEEFNPNLTREFSIQSPFSGATYTIKVGLPLNNLRIN